MAGDWFLRFSSVAMPWRQPKRGNNLFLQNHGSKIIVVNYFQWWLNNEQVCKFTLCNNAKETTLEKLSATHQPLESFMKAQHFFQTSHFIETIELFLCWVCLLIGQFFLTAISTAVYHGFTTFWRLSTLCRNYLSSIGDKILWRRNQKLQNSIRDVIKLLLWRRSRSLRTGFVV